MSLTIQQYLHQIGLVTGPRKKHTSYSGLEVLRKDLFGIPQFVGGEQFFKFGNALHEVFLKNQLTTYKTLPPHEQRMVDTMVSKLREHPVVQRLFKNSIREKKRKGKLEEVELVFILDIEQVKESIGSDLKTTACTSYQDCIKKAVLYGYHKQRSIYKRVKKLKEFYFIFISKKQPHDIFIVGDKEFQAEERYAEKELEFLLYFYKHYGRFMRDGEQQETFKPNTDMAKSKSKESMEAIKEATSILRAMRVENAKKIKAAEKQKNQVLKLVKNFPKSDKPLYQEQLDKIVKGL